MSDRTRIGEIRHRVDLQTRADTADGSGGFTSGWTTSKTVSAKIEPVSAREVQFAGKVKARVTHKITIRKQASVVSHMRVLFQDKVFEIHGVRELDFSNRWLVLDCEEGVAS